MKRYYILEKDLPDIREGAVFESVKEGRYYQHGSCRYPAKVVAFQPEWFRKVSEFEAGAATSLYEQNNKTPNP